MSNPLFAITTLCRLLRLRVQAPDIQQALVTHPAYPGLSAVRGVLQQWHVETLAVQVTEQQLPELDFPCLAYITGARDPFVVLEGVRNGLVWLHRQGQGRHSMPAHDFAADWDGIILLAEPEAAAASAQRAVRWQHLVSFAAYLVLGLLGLGLLGAYLGTTAHLPVPGLWAGLLASKIFGSAVCLLLIQRALGQSSATLDKVCSLHHSFDCDSVLDSSAARLTSWLSAAELGSFYFWGTLLVLLGAPFISPFPTLGILALLSVLTVPYAIFLFFYQRFVVRQWCTLCLLVQAAVWAEAALFWLSRGRVGPPWHWQAAAYVGFGLLGTASIWLVMRPLVERGIKQQGLQQLYRRYSTNLDFFASLLQKQPFVPDGGRFDADLVLGERDAPLTLLLIMDPSCYPCRQLYLQADQLQRRLAGELCLIVRLSTIERTGTDGFAVAQHLLRQPGTDQARAALTAWCSDHYRALRAWQQDFPADSGVAITTVNVFLQDARRWCQQTGINRTPALFLNNQVFPTTFILADWEHFLWHKVTALQPVHELNAVEAVAE